MAKEFDAIIIEGMEAEFASLVDEAIQEAVSEGISQATAEAAVRLVQKVKGDIVECCFIIDLPDIGGRDRLENMDQKVFTLCEFKGE